MSFERYLKKVYALLEGSVETKHVAILEESLEINMCFRKFRLEEHVFARQDTLSSLDAEVSGLKKSLFAASAEAEEAMARVDEWRRWATVAKGKLGSMLSSGMPRFHVVAPPESRSESARSRSPMPVARTARIV